MRSTQHLQPDNQFFTMLAAKFISSNFWGEMPWPDSHIPLKKKHILVQKREPELLRTKWWVLLGLYEDAMKRYTSNDHAAGQCYCMCLAEGVYTTSGYQVLMQLKQDAFDCNPSWHAHPNTVHCHSKVIVCACRLKGVCECVSVYCFTDGDDSVECVHVVFGYRNCGGVWHQNDQVAADTHSQQWQVEGQSRTTIHKVAEEGGLGGGSVKKKPMPKNQDKGIFLGEGYGGKGRDRHLEMKILLQSVQGAPLTALDRIQKQLCTLNQRSETLYRTKTEAQQGLKLAREGGDAEEEEETMRDLKKISACIKLLDDDIEQLEKNMLNERVRDEEERKRLEKHAATARKVIGGNKSNKTECGSEGEEGDKEEDAQSPDKHLDGLQG